MNKRIVLRYASGLYQIQGVETQLKEFMHTDELPKTLDNIDLGDHIGSVKQTRVEKHYVLYEEAYAVHEAPVSRRDDDLVLDPVSHYLC